MLIRCLCRKIFVAKLLGLHIISFSKKSLHLPKKGIYRKKIGTREEYVPVYVRLFVMFVILFVTFVITFVNFYEHTQNQGGQELKIE